MGEPVAPRSDATFHQAPDKAARVWRPVTVDFIGFLVAGFGGALAAGLGGIRALPLVRRAAGSALSALDSRSGEAIAMLELSGAPDVIFLNHALSHLYVAIGDPGVIEVIDMVTWSRVEAVSTEPGAHTIALDETTHRIYALLPHTHRASVFFDDP